eukprot:6457172-Amphidinium_carterae.1
MTPDYNADSPKARQVNYSKQEELHQSQSHPFVDMFVLSSCLIKLVTGIFYADAVLIQTFPRAKRLIFRETIRS